VSEYCAVQDFADTGGTTRYTRTKTNGIWGEWKNIINIENYVAPGNTLDWFKSYLVLDGVSPGIHIFNLILNGNSSMAIVIKTNNNYISFINFGYSRQAVQYNCQDGVWNAKEL
jgi:hypothetical protein